MIFNICFEVITDLRNQLKAQFEYKNQEVAETLLDVKQQTLVPILKIFMFKMILSCILFQCIIISPFIVDAMCTFSGVG